MRIIGSYRDIRGLHARKMKDSQPVGWFWGSIRALAPFEFSAWYRSEYDLHTVWDLGPSLSKTSSTHQHTGQRGLAPLFMPAAGSRAFPVVLKAFVRL